MFYRVILVLMILAFSLIGNGASSTEYWIPSNTPTTQILRRLCFIGKLEGWVVGDLGTIMHTVDGGEAWEIQNSEIETNILDIFFLNSTRGWALSWSLTSPLGTIILETTDGGESWIGENYPVANKFMNKIFFVDSLHGWLGGSPDAFVYTVDGGRQWSDVTIDSGGLAHLPVINFSFFDSNYGFACGGTFDIAGVIWKTINGGKNWYSMGVGPEPIQDIVFFDSLNALGVGGDFEYGTGIVRTSDAGKTWEYTSLGIAGVASAVSFRTPPEGWGCLRIAEKFIVTKDTGLTWNEMLTPNNTAVYDLVFTDSLHGYAVGDNGTFFKYDTTVVGVSDPKLPGVASTVRLYQNYPNPFNPDTNIEFMIPAAHGGGIVKLNIYDLRGRLVRTLVNEPKSPGEYLVKWEGRNNGANPVTSGIYLCRLTVGASSQVRKIILLR